MMKWFPQCSRGNKWLNWYQHIQNIFCVKSRRGKYWEGLDVQPRCCVKCVCGGGEGWGCEHRTKGAERWEYWGWENKVSRNHSDPLKGRSFDYYFISWYVTWGFMVQNSRKHTSNSTALRRHVLCCQPLPASFLAGFFLESISLCFLFFWSILLFFS